MKTGCDVDFMRSRVGNTEAPVEGYPSRLLRSAEITTPKDVTRCALQFLENPDRLKASAGYGECTIALAAHRSSRCEDHCDGIYCEAPLPRNDQTGVNEEAQSRERSDL
jgi:hypothetical protein